METYIVCACRAIQVTLKGPASLRDDDGEEEEEERPLPVQTEDPDTAESQVKPMREADHPASTSTDTHTTEKSAPRPPELNLERKVGEGIDAFGTELPATPGGWQEEWDW